jgi:hypothetical protein
MQKWLLCFVLNFVSFLSWSQKDTTSYKIFSAAQLRQDLDSMYLQLQWNHPQLFAHYKKEDADAAFHKARRSINRPMNRLEFIRIASPFVSLFRDGHTFIDVDFENEDLQQYTKGGGKLFPLGVYIINKRLYAGRTDLATTKIQTGDEIFALNGVQVEKIIQQLKGLWSADGEQNAIATAQRLFAYSLWVAYNWGNETVIDYVQNGVKKREVLNGIGKEDFLKLTFNIGGVVRQLHLHTEYSLAVVEINSYGNVERTNRFIDSCFRVIKEKGIKNVALDLRKNGGGNSYIGDYFLAHLNKKPYSVVRAKKWHISPMVQQLKPDHWLSKMLERDRRTYTQNGPFLESPVFLPQAGATLNDSALFVEARLFLFTSPRTYSSAHMTALGVKCGELGTIIGQPTGERLDLTGEILAYKAPNSGISIVIPVAAYKSGCGDGAQVGVQPDHLVTTTIEDIRKGIDPELEFLKNKLRNE